MNTLACLILGVIAILLVTITVLAAVMFVYKNKYRNAVQNTNALADENLRLTATLKTLQTSLANKKEVADELQKVLATIDNADVNSIIAMLQKQSGTVFS